MSKDRERLLNDLDDYRWHILTQLADEAEENGRVEESQIWRWLLRWKRWPTCRKGEKYGWVVGQFRKNEITLKSERLPRTVKADLGGSYYDNNSTSHASVRKAFEYALKKISEFVQGKGYLPYEAASNDR